MKNIIFTIITFLNLSFFNNAYAQENGGILEDSLSDMYTVVGVGLGGAILGLSTLSFAEEPWDNSRNILVGGAIGIIIGVGIVAWSQGSKSKELYLEGAQPTGALESKTEWRIAWHKASHRELQPTSTSAKFQQLGWSFQF